MRTHFQLFGLFLVSLLLLPLTDLRAQDAAQVGLLELVEIPFELAGDFKNPYDPTEIAIDALFTAPSGETLRVPAFYMQPYAQTCQENCGADRLEPSGQGGWRVRFSPTQSGEWSYRIEATTEAGTTTVREGRFTVAASETRGFVRVSPNKRYFTFQNGESYFPIGQNLGWSGENIGGMDTYLAWLDDLHASGANYARVFADTAWFIGLDWGRTPGDYNDDQAAAWRMDTLLEAAHQRGIYLQVVLIWHRAFIQNSNIPVVIPSDMPRADTGADFDGHSYNAINGGVLTSPAQFFQNTTVKNLLRQRLRYMVARWGYSPNIFAWELITDVDRLPGYDSQTHLDYINELADYVRELDPYPHLLTAGSSQALPELIANDRFDFAQIHAYQRRPIEEAGDQATTILTALYQTQQLAQKPLLLTEFSLNPWYEPTADDPNGIHLRDTIWAAAFSGAAGSGMSQWWDTYIAPQDLYGLYSPLVRFAAGVEWNVLELQPFQVGLVTQKEVPYEALRIDNFNRALRGVSPPDTIYRLLADGAVPSTTSLSSYLYSVNGFNAIASRPQTFIVTPPMPTTLAIGIRDISPSGNANLVITLDDQPYTSLELTAGSKGAAINIPLPAGDHRLVLDNTGDDWVELDYIEIPNYRAPLRAVGLADRTHGVALIWLQNRAATWQNAAAGIDPAVLHFRMDVPAMTPGVYRVEFWDADTGNILGEELHTLSGNQIGTLSIMLLPIRTHLAVKIVRVQAGEPLAQPPSPLPTRTSAIQPTPTPSVTATASPTATPTATSSSTPTATPTNTLTNTPTATLTSTPTNTATSSPTSTPTATLTVTAAASPSATDTPSPTPSPSITPSFSPTPSSADFIPRATRTPRPSGTPR